MRLLIDADYIVYAAGFAAEHTFYLDSAGQQYDTKPKDYQPPLWSRKEVEPVANCLHSAKLMIHKIIDKCRQRYDIPGEDVKLYLTGTANFRDRLATIRPYKGNRDLNHKPVYMRDIREYLVKQWGATVVNWWEADDEVSILQTERPKEIIVAGIDKDLLQVPGIHYVPGKGFKTVTPEEGMMRFYAQVLTGDATDNVGGCYKVGPKKAFQWVKDTGPDEGQLWDLVISAYTASMVQHGVEACGYSDADAAALENAQLLYLLRERQFDEARPKLWSPPQ